MNRNGELWRVPTVGTGDAIPAAGGRYYFQFSRPTFEYASSRAIHLWTTALVEPGNFTGSDGSWPRAEVSKYSLKSRVFDEQGSATGTNEFNDADARFQSWGVAAGDTLWINSRRYACLNTKMTITGVASQTRLTVSPNWGVNCISSGNTSIRYRIWRANPKGECAIDQNFAAGASSFRCRDNTFWRASGPAHDTNLRVYLPDITEGPATLAGTTGVVPSFWDGLAVGAMLEWRYSVEVFNTGSTALGGLGGPFDYNNWDSRQNEHALEHAALDAALALRQ
jgi:hypothetical protein